MKYVITDKVGGCGFEVYKKEVHEMGICNVKGCVVVNHKHLCIEHLKRTLSIDKKPVMIGLDGKSILEIKDFLKEVEINGKI